MNWFDRLKIQLAARLLAPYNLRITTLNQQSRHQAARELTYTSGHLTRAYHVGRKLRALL